MTVFWTLYGTWYLVTGSRSLSRIKWVTGAMLLVVVTLKLIFDLVQSQTTYRFVTFIVVGIVFIAVGYFSPFPQAKQVEGSDNDHESSSSETDEAVDTE